MGIGRMPLCDKHKRYYAHECIKCIEEDKEKASADWEAVLNEGDFEEETGYEMNWPGIDSDEEDTEDTDSDTYPEADYPDEE